METGLGVLAISCDVDPAHDAEFSEWYQRQHVAERLGVPGFIDARRYEAPEGTPRYLAFYRLESAEALTGPRYREALANPTRWTRRTMPWFRDMTRSVCRITLDHGRGVGGWISWVATGPRAGAAESCRARLDGLFEQLSADPEIVRVQLWETDHGITTQPNPEQALRPGGDRVTDWIVTAEAISDGAAARATAAVREAVAGSEFVPGASPAPCYRLTWLMRAADRPVPAPDPPL